MTMRESLEAKRTRARTIIAALEKAYPDAKCALDFTTPLELLVATILAAQCTDERVNLVTSSLLWTAMVIGGTALVFNAVTGVGSGALWVTTSAAALAVLARGRVAGS